MAYTKGSGDVMPPYDPNVNAYTFAGIGYNTGGFKPSGTFVPSFVSANMFANSPNYAHNIDQNNNKSKEATRNNTSIGDKPEIKQQTNAVTHQNGQTRDPIFASLPSISGPFSDETKPNFVSMGVPDSILEIINISQTFPGAIFSGKPDMLGIGSQQPAAVIPQSGISESIPEAQYIPPSSENLTETRLTDPVFSGYPGMSGVGDVVNEQAHVNQVEETKNQTEIQKSSSPYTSIIYAPKPVFSGYPGMLGIGRQAGTEITNEDIMDHSNDGYYNFGGNTMSNAFGTQSPGVNQNDWNGEWPDKISSASPEAVKDWAGAFKEGWQKPANNDTDSEKTTSSSNSTVAEHSESLMTTSSSASSWDGSWPGEQSLSSGHVSSGNGRSSQGHSTQEQTGNFRNTLETLQEFISFLNNMSNGNNQSIGGNGSGGSRSYSDLVGDWAKDIKA